MFNLEKNKLLLEPGRHLSFIADYLEDREATEILNTMINEADLKTEKVFQDLPFY